MTSESQKFNHQVALLCSNNYSSSSSNDSFSPIQDTSFSSFTDLYESQGKVIRVSKRFYFHNSHRSIISLWFLGCYLDQSDGEDPDDVPELRSFHKLQDAGLVRMRTRQIEARIRRKKSRRKKVKIRSESIWVTGNTVIRWPNWETLHHQVIYRHQTFIGYWHQGSRDRKIRGI